MSVPLPSGGGGNQRVWRWGRESRREKKRKKDNLGENIILGSTKSQKLVSRAQLNTITLLKYPR